MTKTQIVLATAGVAALVGGGTALASKGHSHSKKSVVHAGALAHRGGGGDDLDAAATYLGTTASDLITQLQAGKTLAQIAGSKTSGLIAALVNHEKQEIADAVAAGKLTQAQADQIVPTLTQRFTDFVNGVRPLGGPGYGFGPGFGHGFGPSDDLDAAATYLGTTAANLLTQLQAGKTLAAIAGTKASGLIAALVTHEKAEIAAAVTAGRLTQAQADQIVPTLTQRFTDFVNGVRPLGGPGYGFGPGFGHGFGPSDDLDAAATYLGTTAANLLTQLQAGKTLAAIAGTKASGLIAALVTHEKAEIAAAVTAGRLTQAQADQILPMLTQRITDLVNGTFPMRGGPPHGFGGPLNGFGGPPQGFGGRPNGFFAPYGSRA